MNARALIILLLVGGSFSVGLILSGGLADEEALRLEIETLKKRLAERIGSEDPSDRRRIEDLMEELKAMSAANDGMTKSYHELEARYEELKAAQEQGASVGIEKPEVEDPDAASAEIPSTMSAALKGKFDKTLALINELEQGKGNNMQLGMKLVGLVNQFTPEDFKVLMAVQRATEDQDVREDMAKILMNSAVFNPLAMKETLPGFMDDVLTRMEDGEGYSDNFRTGIWFRMSYKQGPANAYGGVVRPLGSEAKERLYTLAAEDLRGTDDVRRMGAAMYLGRTGDKRASPALWDVVRTSENPKLAAVALDALSQIPSPENLDNLRTLRDDTADKVSRANYDRLIARMEAELAKDD